MNRARTGYVMIVLLVAIVLAVPHALQCSWSAQTISRALYSHFVQGFPILYCLTSSGPHVLPMIPGVTGPTYYSEFSYSHLWKGQFVDLRPDFTTEFILHHRQWTVDAWKATLTEPENPEVVTNTEWKFSGLGFRPTVIGDRLLFLGQNQQFEVVDGALQSIDLPVFHDQCQLISIDGVIARIDDGSGTITAPSPGSRAVGNGQSDPLDLTISTRVSGAWNKELCAVLPTAGREWTFGKTGIDFGKASAMTCFNQGEKIHTFLRIDGHLLYHEGLKVRKTDGDGKTRTVGTVDPTAADATDDELSGWSLVRDEVGDEDSWEHQYGTIVEGRPGALIVDNVETGHPVGSLYRLDGTTWSKIATVPFPFGSKSFRTLIRADNQSPYIVATSAVGAGYAYVAEPGGIREVQGQGADQVWSNFRRELKFYTHMWSIAYCWALLPGLGLWGLMAICTKPQYTFGLRTVKLASLGRRGSARVIDIALIAGITFIFGRELFRGFDWMSLAEANALEIDHPIFAEALRRSWTLVLFIVVQLVGLIVMQGCWGMTPGKWICGLRTVRTTLRPCGVAPSFAREFVLCLDSVYLLYWLPGILCFALTQNRQRIGDLIANTIVIEARSDHQAELVQ